MAAITKLDGVVKDGAQAYRVRWNVRTDGGWKARERRVYGREAARELARQMEAEHEGRQAKPVSELTVAEAGEAWLRHYASRPRRAAGGRKVQSTSFDEAVRAIELLVEEYGETAPGRARLFRTLTADDLYTLVENRKLLTYAGTDADGERTYVKSDEPASDGTKQRMAGTLKGFASDAVKLGWRSDDIGADLPSTWGSGVTSREVIPSVRALERIAVHLDELTQEVTTKGGGVATRPTWMGVHDRDAFVPSDRLWLIALTGVSWSEAAGLRVEDDYGDHLKLRRVLLRRDAQPRTTGKAAARVPRDVPVPARLRPILDRLAAYSRSGYLLTDGDGQRLPYETWRNRLSAACTAAEETVTTHELRHVAASLWVRAGAQPFLVMKAGGWSSLEMVSKVYAHLWPSDITELGRKVDELAWDELD